MGSSHSPFLKKRKLIVASLLCVVLLGLGSFYPISAATTFPVQNATQLLSTNPLNTFSYGSASCSYGSYLHALYIDANTGTIDDYSSPDGVNWTGPTVIVTLTNALYTGANSYAGAFASCSGSTLSVAWLTTGGGSGKRQLSYEVCVLDSSDASIVCPSATTGPLSSNSHQINLGDSARMGTIRYLNGLTFIIISPNTGTTTTQVIVNNIETKNFTGTSTESPDIATGGANSYFLVLGVTTTTANYYFSADGTTWSASISLAGISGSSINWENLQAGSPNAGGAGLMSTNLGIAYAFLQDNTATTSGACTGATTKCVEMITLGPTAITTKLALYAAPSSPGFGPIATKDDQLGNTMIVVLPSGVSTTSSSYAFSTNGGSSWSSSTYGGPTVSTTGGHAGYSPSIGLTYSFAMGAFDVTMVNPSANFDVWTQVFGTVSSTTPSTSQTQTIGSCPTKNTATFTMVNNTLYFYYGTTVGQTSVSTISVGVSSVGGSTGTHTIGVYIYYARSSGTISGSNNLIQAFAYTKALTSGTTHFILTVQVSGSLIPSGVQWGVAVVGDNKIVLNQSSLSGLYTQAGVASTGVQSGFFTTQGTSVATQLYLCATGIYSSSTTVTTTISTTITTTTTQNQAGVTANTNGYIGILLIITMFLIGTKFAGIAGGAGAAILGGLVAWMGGWLPWTAFIGLTVMAVLIFYLGRDRGGGGGV